MVKRVILISCLALSLLSCSIIDKFTSSGEPQVIVVTATPERTIPTEVSPTELPPTEALTEAVTTAPTVSGETVTINEPVLDTLTLIAGPFEDSLIKQDNFHTADYCAGVDVKNFKVEVTFTAIPGFNAKKNSFAMYFRDQGDNDQYRVGVREDYWVLADVRMGDFIDINTGTLVMTWGETVPNHMVIYAIDDVGYLYLNGYYISKLNLADRQGSGDVCVVTSEWQSDSYGQISRFEEFKVWELIEK